ncbi:MAG: hypothetical protein ABI143_03800 [Caldimonas sp.]
MRVVQVVLCLFAVTCLAAAGDARAAGNGLASSADRVPWARFDARMVYAPSWRYELAPFERSGLRTEGRAGVFGDIYFGSGTATARAATGGFRATSGLVVGSRSTIATNELLGETKTMPYVGLGYSNIWPKSGWRFNADLGVISHNPGSANGIGRVLGGSQSLDDLVRDLRLAPVLQLGVAYTF